MSLFLCLYPHCVIRKNANAVLLYNTDSGKRIITQEPTIVQTITEASNCIEVIDNHLIESFWMQCVDFEMGFMVECLSKPIISTPINKIITSVEKEIRALGYLSQSHSNSFLNQVTVQTENTLDKGLSDFAYGIIDYPCQGNLFISGSLNLDWINNFESLETLIISGDVKYYDIPNILARVTNSNVVVVFKSFADFYSEKEVNKIVSIYSNVFFEFLLDKMLDVRLLKDISYNRYYNENVFINLLIEDSQIIDNIISTEGVEYKVTPIFNNRELNDKLKNELYVTLADLDNMKKSVKEILIQEQINTSCFGNLCIKQNGDVTCWGQLLGNINTSDLVNLINKWVSKSSDCCWFKTREQHTKCSECLYNILCPPISIYEEMGIIESACGSNIQIL